MVDNNLIKIYRRKITKKNLDYEKIDVFLQSKIDYHDKNYLFLCNNDAVLRLYEP